MKGTTVFTVWSVSIVLSVILFSVLGFGVWESVQFSLVLVAVSSIIYDMTRSADRRRLWGQVLLSVALVISGIKTFESLRPPWNWVFAGLCLVALIAFELLQRKKRKPESGAAAGS